MKWYFTIPLLLMLVAVSAACRRTEEPDEKVGGTFVAEFVSAEPVSLSDLAANPAAYRDKRIQITGEFQPLAQLACADSNPRPGPATWSVVAEGWVAQAGSKFEDISKLLPTGLTVTAEGTWRLWSGAIGCGKRAENVEMWYLEVTELLEPRPLVSMTLTPSGAEAATSPLPGQEGTPLAEAPSATPGPGLGGSNGTPSATRPPLPIATPPSAGTPFATQTVEALSPTPEIEGTATETPTEAATNEDGTPTPESSPTDGPSPTPNLTPGAETPTPTGSATPGEAAVVDMGDAGFHSLVLDTLEPGTRHAYTISVEAGTTITLGLVMPAEFDPVVKLLDQEGKLLLEKNDVGAGEVERIEGFVVEDDAEFRIIVHDIDDRGADYSFTLDDGLSFDFLYFVGLLKYGDTKNTQMPANRLDFWHFYGEEGDEITISLTPNDSSDLRFLLYTPEFDELSDGFVDQRPGGQSEQATFTLPRSGLYTLQVEEFNLLSSDYLVRLTEGQ